MKVFRSSLLSGALLSLLVTGFSYRAAAQSVPPPTAFSRILSRTELGLAATGSITNKVSGTNYLGQQITMDPSTTVGVNLNIRYTLKPYMGFEFNYNYARYTENISVPPPDTSPIVGGAQTNANEYTLGYVIHPPLALLHPWAAVGAGSTEFKPTQMGGQGLPVQARMTYYYGVGIDQPLSPHFGVRAQLRQTFFLAPDFLENYLTILKRQTTIEPGIGFYMRF